MRGDDLLTLLGLAALVATIIKWPRIWRALRFPGSSSWPTLQAIVQQVHVHSYSGHNGTTYRAEISYSYHVDGEYYSGYYTGDLCSSEAEVNVWFIKISRAQVKGSCVAVEHLKCRYDS